MEARLDRKLTAIRKELLDDYAKLIDNLSRNGISNDYSTSQDVVVGIKI